MTITPDQRVALRALSVFANEEERVEYVKKYTGRDEALARVLLGESMSLFKNKRDQALAFSGTMSDVKSSWSQLCLSLHVLGGVILVGLGAYLLVFGDEPDRTFLGSSAVAGGLISFIMAFGLLQRVRRLAVDAAPVVRRRISA